MIKHLLNNSQENLRRTKFFIITISIFMVIATHTHSFLIQKPSDVENKIIPNLKDDIHTKQKLIILIMSFNNNTGDKKLDYWIDIFSELLFVDFSQSRFIKPVYTENFADNLSQLFNPKINKHAFDLVRVNAEKVKSIYVITGCFTRDNNIFHIEIKMRDTRTHKLIDTEKLVVCSEKDIFFFVDKFTEKIKQNLELCEKKGTNDIDMNVDKITTASLKAFKNYIKGRRLINTDENRKGINLLKEAVNIDPGFAMSYKLMAEAYLNLGEESEWKNYLRKTFELRKRLPIKERFRIEGEYFRLSEKSYDKAIEALHNLLRLYPDDVMANNDLGEIYFGLEQWNRAIMHFNININNEVEPMPSYIGQARAYMAIGQYGEARKVLDSYTNYFSKTAIIHRYLALSFLFEEKYDLALAEMDKAFSLDPENFRNFVFKGDILLCKGDLTEAEELYHELLENEAALAKDEGRRRLSALYLLKGEFNKSKEQLEQGIKLAEKIDEKEWKSVYHLRLSYLNRKQGNFEEAVRYSNMALLSALEEDAISLEILSLHSLGLTFLEMKLIDEAQNVADNLRSTCQKELNKKAIRYFYHLIGLIELEKENLFIAIEKLGNAMTLLHSQYAPWIPRDEHALFIDSLALAYYKTGNLAKAKEQYERIISLTTGRQFYGDIYAKSFYRLGKISQKRKMRDQAINYYKKFLEIWRDADPNISELEDANFELISLRRQ